MSESEIDDMASLIKRQDAEIERLQAGNAERDTRIAQLVEDNDCIPELEAAIGRLRAALRPFAEVPPGGYGPDERIIMMSAGNGAFHIYQRDLDRAKEVLASAHRR